MYRVHLSDPERQELQRRAHVLGVRPRTRDRLEMVRLADAGWRVPQIARHLGMCEKSVRRWLAAFREAGFDALRDQPPTGRTSRLTAAIREGVRQEFAKGERTWTASQGAAWVAERFGVDVSVSHLRRLLRRWKLSYKRTTRSLQHKQKPEEVAVKKPELEALEKRGSRA
ncbi:MAG TPA: helix-turn-helix domain-containing protein [Gemmatimonadales bacterium]|nr:helix-turn-helix domain-containing protein [Gemmatimonadales bacterium]